MAKSYREVARFPSKSNPSKEYTVNVDENGDTAKVSTVVRGRFSSGRKRGPAAGSSADLPGLLVRPDGSFSAYITWEWVLRGRTWYYRGPLPGAAGAAGKRR